MNGSKRSEMGFETTADNRRGGPLTAPLGKAASLPRLQSQPTYHLGTHTSETWWILQILTAFQIKLQFLFFALNTL